MLVYVGPSWPQVGPKLPPSLRMLAQVGASWPKLGPSWSQYGPKLSHVGSCCPLPPSPQKEFLWLCFPRCPRRLCLYEGAANVQVTSRCLSICLTNVQVARMFHPAGAFKTKDFLWNFLTFFHGVSFWLFFLVDASSCILHEGILVYVYIYTIYARGLGAANGFLRRWRPQRRSRVNLTSFQG